MTAAKKPTYGEVCGTVFQELSSINVNEHTEKKGNLTYLSWAWAYMEMMNKYPTFAYRFDDMENHPDGTVTVHCTTQITLDEFEIIKTMWLPVMDFRNNAISNPDSMAINTAKMRCLTKCISMHGLGAYIYAGEDLPADPSGDAPKTATPKKKATKKTVAKKTAVKKEEPQRTAFTVGDAQFEIEDAEGAEFVVDSMIQLVNEMHSDSMDNLISFWKGNSQVIDYLSANYPDEFARLKDTFTEIKTTLIGDE